MNNIKKKEKKKLHNITGCSSSEKLSLNMYLTFQYISIYLIYLIRGFRCVQEYLNYNNDIKEELIHTQAPWKPWLLAVSCIFPRESNKLKISMLDHCVQICDKPTLISSGPSLYSCLRSWIILLLRAFLLALSSNLWSLSAWVSSPSGN